MASEGRRVYFSCVPPRQWSDRDLLQFILERGSPTSITLRTYARTSGYCSFVEFPDVASAQAAVGTLNGSTDFLAGATLVVEFVDRRAPTEKNNLYISGFPCTWNMSRLIEYAQPYGRFSTDI